jgi:hypothetical protein
VKITKVGTFKEAAGGTLISGFEFDAEGGPIDMDEFVRLAREATDQHLGDRSE